MISSFARERERGRERVKPNNPMKHSIDLQPQ
jgi:hypothetical protein